MSKWDHGDHCHHTIRGPSGILSPGPVCDRRNGLPRPITREQLAQLPAGWRWGMDVIEGAEAVAAGLAYESGSMLFAVARNGSADGTITIGPSGDVQWTSSDGHRPDDVIAVMMDVHKARLDGDLTPRTQEQRDAHRRNGIASRRRTAVAVQTERRRAAARG